MIIEIARREVVTRGRSKAFLISTLVLLALAVVGVIVAALLDGDDDERREATVGYIALPDQLTELITREDRSDLDITLRQLDPAEVDDAVEGDVVDVVIDATGADPVLVWKQSADPELQFVIAAAFAEIQIVDRATELELTGSELTSLLTPPAFGERLLDEQTDEDEVRLFVGLVGILVTLLAIQIYGQQLMMAVVEEKASRVVEVLLAHIRPRQLLVGKLIGFTLLVIVQTLIVLVGLFVGLTITDFVDVPRAALAAVPLILVTFVLGFALYAALFALLGSLVSRQEDAQAVIAPAVLPLLAGYLVGIQALSSPDSTLATVTSLLPLTSSFVLPVVVAGGEGSVPLVALALVLLALTVWGVLRLAGKLYELTLLHTGTRIRFGDAIAFALRSSERSAEDLGH